MVKLTEWIWKLIPKTRWCISKWADCDFQGGDGWRARKSDNRWGASTARRWREIRLWRWLGWAVVRESEREKCTPLLCSLWVTWCRGVEFPSCRLVLTLMAFFGFLNIYCLRVNLSVALVAMVNHTALAVEPKNVSVNATDECGNVISRKEKKTKEVNNL